MLIKKFLFIGAIVFSIQNVLSQEIEKKEYYDNGDLKCVYSIDKNGMKMGEEKLFDKSGVLKEKKKWLEGKVIDWTCNKKVDIKLRVMQLHFD